MDAASEGVQAEDLVVIKGYAMKSDETLATMANVKQAVLFKGLLANAIEALKARKLFNQQIVVANGHLTQAQAGDKRKIKVLGRLVQGACETGAVVMSADAFKPAVLQRLGINILVPGQSDEERAENLTTLSEAFGWSEAEGTKHLAKFYRTYSRHAPNKPSTRPLRAKAAKMNVLDCLAEDTIKLSSPDKNICGDLLQATMAVAKRDLSHGNKGRKRDACVLKGDAQNMVTGNTVACFGKTPHAKLEKSSRANFNGKIVSRPRKNNSH